MGEYNSNIVKKTIKPTQWDMEEYNSNIVKKTKKSTQWDMGPTFLLVRWYSSLPS